MRYVFGEAGHDYHEFFGYFILLSCGFTVVVKTDQEDIVRFVENSQERPVLQI